MFGRLKNIVLFSSNCNRFKFTLSDAIKLLCAFYCLIINASLICHSLMLPSYGHYYNNNNIYLLQVGFHPVAVVFNTYTRT